MSTHGEGRTLEARYRFVTRKVALTIAFFHLSLRRPPVELPR